MVASERRAAGSRQQPCGQPALGSTGGRSNLLMSAFVSTTTRALAFVGKDFGQLFLGHPSRGRTLADAVTEALKLVRVERAQPIVFLRREEHGNVPVLSADHDRLALRGVEKRGEALLGFGGRYRAHDNPSLSNLDKLDNLSRYGRS